MKRLWGILFVLICAAALGYAMGMARRPVAPLPTAATPSLSVTKPVAVTSSEDSVRKDDQGSDTGGVSTGPARDKDCKS